METDRFFEQHQGHTEKTFLRCAALAFMVPYLPSPRSALGFSLHLAFLRHAMSHDYKQEYTGFSWPALAGLAYQGCSDELSNCHTGS
jgi:hypothetical protein